MENNFNVLAAAQTRSGLSAIKEMWLDSIEENPWVDYSYIQEGLWETDSIIFPIFALKYEWDGSGTL